MGRICVRHIQHAAHNWLIVILVHCDPWKWSKFAQQLHICMSVCLKDSDFNLFNFQVVTPSRNFGLFNSIVDKLGRALSMICLTPQNLEASGQQGIC